MGKTDVYEAILRRIQATELAQQSNAVLHEELEQVKQDVAQLNAAMVHIREVQTAMRRLAHDVPVSSSSPGFKELLRTTQSMQNQIEADIGKMTELGGVPPLIHSEKPVEQKSAVDVTSVGTDPPEPKQIALKSGIEDVLKGKTKEDKYIWSRLKEIADLAAKLQQSNKKAMDIQSFREFVNEFRKLCSECVKAPSPKVVEIVTRHEQLPAILTLILDALLHPNATSGKMKPLLEMIANYIAIISTRNDLFRTAFASSKARLVVYANQLDPPLKDHVMDLMEENIDVICNKLLHNAQGTRALPTDQDRHSCVSSLLVRLRFAAKWLKFSKEQELQAQMKILHDALKTLIKYVLESPESSEKNLRLTILNAMRLIGGDSPAFASVIQSDRAQLEKISTENKKQKLAKTKEKWKAKKRAKTN